MQVVRGGGVITATAAGRPAEEDPPANRAGGTHALTEESGMIYNFNWIISSVFFFFAASTSTSNSSPLSFFFSLCLFSGNTKEACACSCVMIAPLSCEAR